MKKTYEVKGTYDFPFDEGDENGILSGNFDIINDREIRGTVNGRTVEGKVIKEGEMTTLSFHVHAPKPYLDLDYTLTKNSTGINGFFQGVFIPIPEKPQESRGPIDLPSGEQMFIVQLAPDSYPATLEVVEKIQ